MKPSAQFSTSQWRLLVSTFLILAALTAIVFTVGNAHAANYEKQSFNDDWRFIKGDPKAAADVDFDDKKWKALTLPHDWAIAGPFDKKYNARNGGLPVFGTAWYRKNFTLPANVKDKVISLTFDGAMDNSQVYVNGHLVGERPFGYIAFQFDISKFVYLNGKKNTVAVRLSPKNYSARWYSGAGLYRNTWLEINDAVHVAPWGTYVTTPQVSKAQASVLLETNIQNKGANTNAEVITEIMQADGKIIERVSETLNQLNGDSVTTLKQAFTIKQPILWDITNPYRYRVVTTIKRNKKVVDRYETPLGIRKLEFKADDGFWLNDRRVQIQGVCLHHDNGPLGAAVNSRAIERKFQIMKEMGVNAVRTSHNPPSAELVELADKMGIMLQVEAFDMWQIEKNTVVNGYHQYFDQWHERDLTAMVVQNRNNPSVIMWSTGNEVMEQKAKNGWRLAKKLTDIVHKHDPSRLVTNGLSMYPQAIDGGMAEQLDIVGLNYKAGKYADIHKKHPQWLLLGAETSSVVSTRGEYHFPIKRYKKHPSNYVSSYDIIAPPWAYIPDFEFAKLAQTPAVMGEFIWTGFDYLGEPTPYGGRDHGNKAYWNGDWPARSSSFGAVDLAGFKKDRFYLYQSQWTKKPMVHVLPHWNWPNKIGENIPVMVYSNAEEVELFVNGKSLGRKVKGVDTVPIPVKIKFDDDKLTVFNSPYRLSWQVPYQPGALKVVAYTDGQVVASEEVKTAGVPANVELIADRHEISADGQDLSFITVLIKDKHGNICPTAANKVIFSVKGAGEIAAVGNGDSATTDSFIANYRRAFNGKALLVIRGKKAQAGKIAISAYSDRLTGDNITLTAR